MPAVMVSGELAFELASAESSVLESRPATFAAVAGLAVRPAAAGVVAVAVVLPEAADSVHPDYVVADPLDSVPSCLLEPVVAVAHWLLLEH